MRTLFLLGILVSLIAIATKDDNQTAMDAAMEMGQKAKNLVSKYDKTSAASAIQDKVEETRETTNKKVDPFIHQAKEAIAKSKKGTPRYIAEPGVNKSIQKTTLPVSIKPVAKENTPSEKPDWIMPKARELAMPEISAMPKAPVEEFDLGTEITVEATKTKPVATDADRSFDLVRGYYENASRLLEEIK